MIDKKLIGEKVQVIASKISRQPHLVALRDAMSSAMPLILIGSMFMLIAQFPYEPFTQFLENIGLQAYFNKASDSTFGMLGLAVVFSTAYNLAKHYKVDALSTGLLSLSSFILLTPFVATDGGMGIQTKYFGSSGLFVGIIVAFFSTEIFRALIQRDIRIKMPDSVPLNVSKAFSAIIPGGIVVAFWIVVSMIFAAFGIDNIHQFVTLTLGSVLGVLGNTLPGIIFVIIVQCFFWMFGIHGAQVTAPIIEPLLLQNSDMNRIAYQAGEQLPNIITYEFLYNFVFTGGAGCLIALAIILFFKSKSKENKVLGKLSLAPVSFQIAEPVIFGAPIIMNVKMLIPFVLAPVITAIITYYAMALGFVALPIGAVIPWTTPPIISGYLATGGRISGAVIQIITIAINIMIYYPFFKMDDKEKLKAETLSENIIDDGDFDLNDFEF